MSSSPRVLTKVLALVIEVARRKGAHNYPYLDNVLVRHTQRQNAKINVNILNLLLKVNRWLINKQKAFTDPSQDRTSIGDHFVMNQNLVMLRRERPRSQALKASI